MPFTQLPRPEQLPAQGTEAGIEQFGPIQPASHTHTELALTEPCMTHVPCSLQKHVDLVELTGTEQSLPDHDGSQRHSGRKLPVRGLHTPCPEQVPLHFCSEQSKPVQPMSHWHTPVMPCSPRRASSDVLPPPLDAGGRYAEIPAIPREVIGGAE